ncbi:uncharacterized protein M6G45_010461 isoform 1-T1 [Spheniscus humboldti]
MAAGGGVSHLPQVCSTQSTEERKRPVLETTTPPLLRQLHLLHQQCDRLQVSLALANRGYGLQAPLHSTVLGAQPRLMDAMTCYSSSKWTLQLYSRSGFLQLPLMDGPACYCPRSSFIQLWLMDAPACWVQLQMMDAPSCYSSSYVKLQLIHTSTAGCSLFLQAN